MKRNLSSILACACVLAAACSPATAHNRASTATTAATQVVPITAEIRRHFDTMEQIRREGGDAERLLRYMYWPDVIIDGGGSPKTYRGLDDAMPDMKAIVASMHGTCGYDFRYPTVTGPDVAVVFGGVECRDGDKEPVKTKAVWVWLKRGSDWKIIREVFVMEPLR